MGSFEEIKTGKQGATLPIKWWGTVQLTWGKTSISLENCLFVPDIVINLISAGELNSKGCTLIAKDSMLSVFKGGKVALRGSVFTINNPDSIGSLTNYSVNLSSHGESLKEIHEKFGHASIQRLNSLLPSSKSKCERDNFECKSCVLSKITKNPFNRQSKRAERPFDQIHLDLIGPIKPESKLKHRFILTVVNNHSGYLAGFPLVNKDDTTDVLINLLETKNHRRGYFPNLICSDGGGEFIGKEPSEPTEQLSNPWGPLSMRQKIQRSTGMKLLKRAVSA